MRETFILALLCVGLAAPSDLSGYGPRGWRPNGPRFNPDNDRLYAYYDTPGSRSYGPPDIATTTERDPLFDATTTRPRTTTLTIVKTTTPRSISREPTTTTAAPSEQPEDDFDANPALAIANSFAFNRPIYIYNGFPFIPAHIIAQ